MRTARATGSREKGTGLAHSSGVSGAVRELVLDAVLTAREIVRRRPDLLLIVLVATAAVTMISGARAKR